MTAGGRFASGGQGQPMGRGLPPGGYYPSPGYNQGYGYDQGYGGYEAGYGLGHEQGHVGYDQGYTGYDNYGGYVALQQPDPRQAGMTMVPMMLPSGQVASSQPCIFFDMRTGAKADLAGNKVSCSLVHNPKP